MSKKQNTTIDNLEHKLRAQLVRLYESACDIKYPRASDVAFRDAIQARIDAGVKALAPALAAEEEALIGASQDVRLYMASAKITNPDAADQSFRIRLQHRLGSFFKLREVALTVTKGGAK